MSENPTVPPTLLTTPIDGTLFRQTMSRYASGVTVVTAMDAAGVPWGLTANAVSSVSLNPPLVLMCIDKKANTYEAVTKASFFAINFLNRQQVVTTTLNEGQPLLFYDRKFGTFIPNPPQPVTQATEPDPWALDYF